MKNVLLLVHDDKGQEARVQAALDLSRILDGHLSCIDVTELPMIGLDDYGGAGSAMLLDRESAREAANKAALESRLSRESISWDWADYTGSIAKGILDAAAFADIIVLNAGAGSDHATRSLASDIVMHARKPILAVPPTLYRLRLNRAMVAWDGHNSSIATLEAAVPLLKYADEVEIFMVRDGPVRKEPREAADYLQHNGIDATIFEVRDGLTAPDAHILDRCTEWKPDYVVMGAYGRGRIMETFGGVTRRMLAKAPVPLVIGH